MADDVKQEDKTIVQKTKENKIAPQIIAERKTVEFRSLIQQINTQQMTVGVTLQGFLRQKIEKEGKKFQPEPFMRVQRGYTWNRTMASNFVFAMMCLTDIDEPIRFYHEDMTSIPLKCLNGQQRLTTIWKFVNDLLILDMRKIGYSKFIYDNKIHNVSEIDGKKFSEIPEEWQDRLLNKGQDIVILHNCTEKQACEFYKRMSTTNKPLRPIEIRRADMSDTMYELVYENFLNNSWTRHVMTANSIVAAYGLDLSTQFLSLVAKNEAMEMSRDNIDNIIHELSNFGIDKRIRGVILNTASYLNETTQIMTDNKKLQDKENQEKKKGGRRIRNYNTYRFKMFKNKTISLSFLLAAWYAQERKVTPEVFANWAPKFFENPSEKYKSSLGTNSTKVGDLPNVRIRLSALQEEMDKLKNKSSK
mgnify:CR=1 FL=1|jgi:hypothetical protein